MPDTGLPTDIPWNYLLVPHLSVIEKLLVILTFVSI